MSIRSVMSISPCLQILACSDTAGGRRLICSAQHHAQHTLSGIPSGTEVLLTSSFSTPFTVLFFDSGPEGYISNHWSPRSYHLWDEVLITQVTGLLLADSDGASHQSRSSPMNDELIVQSERNNALNITRPKS